MTERDRLEEILRSLTERGAGTAKDINIYVLIGRVQGWLDMLDHTSVETCAVSHTPEELKAKASALQDLKPCLRCGGVPRVLSPSVGGLWTATHQCPDRTTRIETALTREEAMALWQRGHGDVRIIQECEGADVVPLEETRREVDPCPECKDWPEVRHCVGTGRWHVKHECEKVRTGRFDLTKPAAFNRWQALAMVLEQVQDEEDDNV